MSDLIRNGKRNDKSHQTNKTKMKNLKKNGEKRMSDLKKNSKKDVRSQNPSPLTPSTLREPV